MDNIKVLIQELTEKMKSLQTEFVNCKRQKDVLMVLEYLKSIKNVELGYTTIINEKDDLYLSNEGMADFIKLLNSNEYLEGYRFRGVPFEGLRGYEIGCKFSIYYLTFGPGTVLELAFCIPDKAYATRGNRLTMRTFADTQDLCIKANRRTYLESELLTQNGTSAFDFITFEEDLKFNNQKLNEALMPVSVDDLFNRFLDMLQKQEDNGFIGADEALATSEEEIIQIPEEGENCQNLTRSEEEQGEKILNIGIKP